MDNQLPSELVSPGIPPRPPRAAVIVAHPDDETLWCGGFLLRHRDWTWTILALCRASDMDRAWKFRKTLKHYGARGEIGDLDDGPEQRPLSDAVIREMIFDLLPEERFDLVLTHGPSGEYTHHLRHEECSRAVAGMWQAGLLRTGQLWMFAHEDDGGAHLPRPSPDADRNETLTADEWEEKRRILQESYGFAADSWEVRAAPREEAFHCFVRPVQALNHITAHEVLA